MIVVVTGHNNRELRVLVGTYVDLNQSRRLRRCKIGLEKLSLERHFKKSCLLLIQDVGFLNNSLFESNEGDQTKG